VREVTSIALEYALPVLPDLVDQPVRLMGFQKTVVSEHVRSLAMRLEDQHGDLKLVDAQMKNRVIQLAGDLEWARNPRLARSRHRYPRAATPRAPRS